MTKQELNELKELKKLENIKKLAEAKKKEDYYNRKNLKKLRFLTEVLTESGELYELTILKELKEFNKTTRLKNSQEFNTYITKKNLNQVTDTDYQKFVIQLEELENLSKQNQFNLLSKELNNISINKNNNGNEPANKDEWLRWLHQRYSEKFLKDNDRIWTVTSIFIPLSLAGLGSVKDGTTMSTLLLALGSISLMIFWYIICEKHRSFQERSDSIVSLIEKQIGINTDVIKVNEPFYDINIKEIENPSLDQYIQRSLHNIFREVNIQKARRYMLYFVTIAWFTAVILVMLKDDLINYNFFQVNINFQIILKELIKNLLKNTNVSFIR